MRIRPRRTGREGLEVHIRPETVGALLLEAVRPPERRRVPLDETLALASSDELVRLGVLAIEHRVAGVVYQSLQAVGVDHPVMQSLRREYLAAAGCHLTLLAELANLAPVIFDRGQPWAVLKGPVLVELSYGNAGLRSYGDLDLLTSAWHLGALLEAVERHGGSCLEGNWPLLARLRHGELTLRLPRGAMGDLHWDPIYYPSARARFSLLVPELLERAERKDVGGVVAPVLEPADELLHLCVHGALSGGHQLVWLKDLERVVCGRQPEWQAVLDRAVRYRVGLPAALMLDRAARLVGANVPKGIVEALAPDRALLTWWRRRDAASGGAQWARPARTGRTLMAASSTSSLATLRCLAATARAEARRRSAATWATGEHERPEAIFDDVGGPAARREFFGVIAREAALVGGHGAISRHSGS